MKRCSCAARSAAECVCGAWDEPRATTDWTDDAMCLSELADRLEQESADESERGNDSAATAWSCRAYELRQIVSKMVRSNAGVEGASQ